MIEELPVSVVGPQQSSVITLVKLVKPIILTYIKHIMMGIQSIAAIESTAWLLLLQLRSAITD